MAPLIYWQAYDEIAEALIENVRRSHLWSHEQRVELGEYTKHLVGVTRCP